MGWVGLGGLVLLATSGLGCPPPGPDPGSGTTTTTTGNALLLPSGRRVIARVARGGDCPTISGQGGEWRGVPTMSKDVRAPNAKALCTYEWYGPGGARDRLTAKVADFRSNDAVLRVENDPPIAGGLANTTLELAKLAETGRKQLRAQALGLGSFPGQPLPVDIGVPDSSPAPSGKLHSGDIPLGESPHGFNVAWIARYLSCPDGGSSACASAIHTDLALGEAGAVGTRLDVADSIARLVDDNLSPAREKLASKANRLVLLLAWGWEPDDECAEAVLDRGAKVPSDIELQDEGSIVFPKVKCTSGMREPSFASQRVFTEIARGVCRGALPIAAAGNMGSTEHPAGPMYPAAWMAETITPQHCERWFGESSIDKGRPLVYAVSAADDKGCPASISRPESETSLVAGATHMVAYPDHRTEAGYETVCGVNPVLDGGVCEHSLPKSGTSLAAAVAAGAAAAVWAYDPKLSADDVMLRLWDTGTPLGRTAALKQWAGKEAVKRVALCKALLATGVQVSCPDPTPVDDPKKCPVLPPPLPPPVTSPTIMGADVEVRGQPNDPCPDCIAHVPTANGSDNWNVIGNIAQTTLGVGETYTAPQVWVYRNGAWSYYTNGFSPNTSWTQTSNNDFGEYQYTGAANITSVQIRLTKNSGGRQSSVSQDVTIQAP